jgi:hypothetical protein
MEMKLIALYYRTFLEPLLADKLRLSDLASNKRGLSRRQASPDRLAGAV